MKNYRPKHSRLRLSAGASLQLVLKSICLLENLTNIESYLLNSNQLKITNQ